eukprot:1189770-Prorocentrum_minimum.AAC.1
MGPVSGSRRDVGRCCTVLGRNGFSSLAPYPTVPTVPTVHVHDLLWLLHHARHHRLPRLPHVREAYLQGDQVRVEKRDAVTAGESELGSPTPHLVVGRTCSRGGAPCRRHSSPELFVPLHTRWQGIDFNDSHSFIARLWADPAGARLRQTLITNTKRWCEVAPRRGKLIMPVLAYTRPYILKQLSKQDCAAHACKSPQTTVSRNFSCAKSG